MAFSVTAVSISVSPLRIDDGDTDMFITSAPSRLPANSHDARVRVEASENLLISVRPRCRDCAAFFRGSRLCVAHLWPGYPWESGTSHAPQRCRYEPAPNSARAGGVARAPLSKTQGDQNETAWENRNRSRHGRRDGDRFDDSFGGSEWPERRDRSGRRRLRGGRCDRRRGGERQRGLLLRLRIRI